MGVTEGYLYARPLREEDWSALADSVEPNFLGMIIGSLMLIKCDPPVDAINIANRAALRQQEACYAWRRQKKPYAESGFLWDDRERCKPPLSVAAAADQIAGAMEAGDEEVTWLIEAAANELRWEPEEAAPDCIRAMRDLAKACRIVAEKGAVEVTVFLES